MYRFALFLIVIGILTTSSDSATFAQDKGKKKAKEAKEVAANPDAIKEDLSRVLPVFDPGTHTQPISAMGFTKDNKRLVTVGQDFTVQVWSTATGERLDILRLPGYGREKGYDAGRWDVAAVSADGTRVALGGQVKLLSAEGDDRTGRLVMVDVVKRTVNRVEIKTGLNRPVTAVAFSPDGDTLALAVEKGPKEGPVLIVVGDLTNRIKNAKTGLRTLDSKHVAIPNSVTQLEFSPDGQRLLVAAGKQLLIWNIPRGATPTPQLAKELSPGTRAMGFAWSPDGKQFVHTVMDNNKDGRVRGFDLRSADGELIKEWRTPDLNSVFAKGFFTLFGVRYLDVNTLYLVANGGGGALDGGGTIPIVVDLRTGKPRRLGLHTEGMVTVPSAAATADGKLIGYTVTGNTEVLLGPLDGSTTVRCGQRSPVPYYLGWSNEPARPGFAWTSDRSVARRAPVRDPSILLHGFDLTKVEPVSEVRSDQYDMSHLKVGDWSIKFFGVGAKALNDGLRGSRLIKGDKPITELPINEGSPRTLIPNGEQPPLIALGTHPNYEPERAYIYKADGSVFTRLLPGATSYTDMASSPDGRFLICTTGTPRIVIYRTDGSTYPLLSFAQLNGEWVCWTPEGYYAASPGGEKMFGWAINNGANSLVTFHAAEKYAKRFRRPDVIRLAIEKGSVKEALVALNSKKIELDSIQPPTAKLALIEQRGSTVKLQASATSGDKSKPITAMRLLLDGRPLPDGRGVWTPEGGKPAEESLQVVIPAGSHELKLLVRTAEGATVSDPLIVKGERSPNSQPTLHRVCIGINEYADSTLKLAAATQDAKNIFDSLATNCVGAENRFGTAKGALILDKDATRDRVLKALADARKQAKPGDLLVIFFAGHGVKQENEFYLLTQEANVEKSLQGFSLSGDDLRKALKDVECPVLLVLDACHSAKAVQTFRPATDDLTRSLTDDTIGVTVLSAAMSHETAGATAENGYFTAGLLKGLRAESGVPFDPYERQLYVHHLYSVAFSEVRKATNGKQNPFLNMPWTSPPLVVRDVK